MTASFFHSSNASSFSSAIVCEQTSVMFGPITKIGSELCESFSVMFWFSPQFEPKSSDRVALYKVGFCSTKDFVCYKWIPASALTSEARGKCCSYTVDFESEMLPNDSDESYQICYLMKDGHIQGMSTTFKLNDTEVSSTPTSAVEEAARNVLSVRVRELTKENSDLKKEMEDIKNEASLMESKNEKLEQEIKEISSIMKDEAELNKKLKQHIEENFVQTEKMKIERFTIMKDVEEKSLINQDLEKRLADTVLSMNDLRDRLAETEGEKSIGAERYQVLADDNKELRETIKAVKLELETFMKEKIAAEKIASDLSHELQTTRENYHELTQINSKLLRKIKKFKRIIALMEASNNDDTGSIEDYLEKKCMEEDPENDNDLMSASVSASIASGAISHCPSSTCSQKLNDTVVTVKETMDRIVHRLSEQTEEMKSLKREISRRSLDKSSSSSHIKEKSKKEEKPATMIEDKVLYEKSFLPANCTAPVFFPDNSIKSCSLNITQNSLSQNTIPSAPSPTPSMMREEAGALPPPILPIPTRKARQAEVLSLKNLSDNTDGTNVGELIPQNYPPVVERPRQSHQPESDDDDYHSTGDAGEQPSAEQPSILKCPLCPLEFMPSGIHLLNTHINCHLDKICPICSLVIEMNTSQKEFEKHVQSHFSDEAEDSENDPSGPWDPRDPSRSFQLLEID
ncbi:Calcium-binding and coiled-coil domain-containing protein 2 [Armadillidium vulgare]|nr:Calcium-binding and coiled-coil domain-containing protein 2 [Armadillidium vulgare]